MQIRIAQNQDIPVMASAYIAAFREVDPSERWTQASAEALISFFITLQPDLSFVAEENGEVAGGIAGLAKPWWDGYHLVQTELFISPKWQRQSVGSALFYHFLGVAQRKYNVTHMESITFKGLEFPSAWYAQLGFENKDDWKIIFGDIGKIRQVLAKKLGVPHKNIAVNISK